MLNSSRNRVMLTLYRSYWGWLWLLMAGQVAVAQSQPPQTEVFFREKVAPILQARCVACHNDDLDEGGVSFQNGDWIEESGHVEPGDAVSSYLLQLVTPASDQPAAMPQDGDPLSEEQRNILKQWIEQGAIWPSDARLALPEVRDFQWWSLQPLQKPAFPAVDAENPIDKFLGAQLDRHGLQANPTAAPRDLVRRLFYDLIGLPPTAEQVQQFEADHSPRAYRELVDRLLASPRYGERWGRHWLDVARYADTCGYDKDKPRPHAWPYRDYVIRSFNEDKNWSQFVKEQVAGDYFFPQSSDGIVGLGFLAAGPWDFIGHVEVPESKLDGKEARNLDRDEIVSAVFNVFCSTTVQCARCHNHKFDPISQRNYYDLQAVFAGIDRADRLYDSSPQVGQQRTVLLADLEEKRQALTIEKQKWQATQPADHVQSLTEFVEEVSKLKPTSLPEQYGYHSQLSNNPDEEKWIELRWEKPVSIKRLDLFPCYDDYAGIGAGFGFPVGWRLESEDQLGQVTTVRESWQPGRPEPFMRSLEFQPPLETQRLRLVATELRTRDQDYHFCLSEIKAWDVTDTNVSTKAKLNAMDSIEAKPRWSLVGLTDDRFPQYPESESDSLRLKLQSLQQIEVQQADSDFRIRRQAVQQTLRDLERQLRELPSRSVVYAAATDFPANGNFQPTKGTPREVFLLQRGQVAQPGAVASPGALPLRADEDPRFHLAAGASEAERRAELADWITDRDNPLTWRSIVNRVWLHHFGQGLVATANDFGRMGQTPTHPALLDWLACEFRDNGQSIKELHRWIVTSQAYQRSCADNPRCREEDGDNQFYWRMNRRRLSAEEIRDSMLQVSGHLNLEMGGPGYYLFELEKPEHSPHYEYHLFDPATVETHRRTVYRFVVRSQPDPMMTTLDCADSSQSVPQRDQTLTALQALSLMNNGFVLLMSEYLAERLQRDHAQLSDQLRFGFRDVTGRFPGSEELQSLEEYAQQHGLVNACRVLLNLNEFVFVE